MPTQCVRWQPPAVGTNKENFDGAICKEEQQAGLGVVIWNCKGEVLVELSQSVPFPHNGMSLFHSVEAVKISRAL